jgi:hypothetical protein
MVSWLHAEQQQVSEMRWSCWCQDVKWDFSSAPPLSLDRENKLQGCSRLSAGAASLKAPHSYDLIPPGDTLSRSKYLGTLAAMNLWSTTAIHSSFLTGE